MDTTYRCINLVDRSEVGQTAASPELAKLVAGPVSRAFRVGMERTDWVDHFGKMKVHRSILVDAESSPGDWDLGA